MLKGYRFGVRVLMAKSEPILMLNVPLGTEFEDERPVEFKDEVSMDWATVVPVKDEVPVPMNAQPVRVDKKRKKARKKAKASRRRNRR